MFPKIKEKYAKKIRKGNCKVVMMKIALLVFSDPAVLYANQGFKFTLVTVMMIVQTKLISSLFFAEGVEIIVKNAPILAIAQNV